ncbi:hypothetical protein [Parageobacillus toebii]|jgi:hypothetical protein|nr:hypothetical protein [Parageobacillus toebii]QNU33227.1 hypothetical protein IC802_09440 [Geobacillus sp. 44C]QSB49035.1 hypothetical protein JTI59_01370 [Parageobacillus toebii]
MLDVQLCGLYQAAAPRTAGLDTLNAGDLTLQYLRGRVGPIALGWPHCIANMIRFVI